MTVKVASSGDVTGLVDEGHRAIAALLIEQGILPQDAARLGRIRFDDVSMSHSSYRVTVDDEPLIFVKLHDPARGVGRTLAAESIAYRLAWSRPSLAQQMPGCQMITDDDALLVLELLPAQSLDWAMTGPVDEPGQEQLLARYGQSVAAVHQTLPPAFGDPPWFFWGTQSLAIADPMHPAAALSQRLSSSAMLKNAALAARRDWQATGLVHGDLRWANVILRPGDDSTDRAICLVDWELAGLGDPAWDLGGVLADLVASRALRTHAEVEPERVARLLRAFAGAYRSTRHVGALDWYDLAVRSTRCAGLRLAQTLHEWGHVDPAMAYQLEPALGRWMFETAARPENHAGYLWNAL